MAASSKIMLLNGPNLNMLGVREPAIYGTDTLDDIHANCLAKGAALGLEIDFRQSNSEGELVGWIQSARGDHGGIIINPAAYTHTSIAIMDALIAAELPVIELHLSNPLRREAFRRHSYVSEVARGVICGFGGLGYELAIDAMARIISDAGDDA
ncbi:MAG: type II 3-dehydroquinate dehydratase [Rhodospirillales bacterium]|nr:type II 3-dehydroquinate dehydratase [Rhodospirillales bacterium]